MELRYFGYPGFAPVGEENGFFLHDFVRIDLPYGAVVSAFAHFVNRQMLSDVVVDAWRNEAAELGQALSHRQDQDSKGEEPAIFTFIGEPRSRRDAVIIPLRWSVRVGPWIAPVDADLELVAFGPGRTHLHLLGRSRLPDGVPPCTDRASLEHRLAVAVVRHALYSLATMIVDESTSSGRP